MKRLSGELFGDGFGVALATPFRTDGSVDDAALVRLVRHVVQGGADFVVALGSTAEAPMLSESERDHVVATIREQLGATRLVIGTGAPSTAQAVTWTRRARELGADAAMLVVPPYTKPTQAGIVAHFAAVCDATPELPLLAYNVPARTGANLELKTLPALWELPSVVGLKESSCDLLQIARIAAEMPADRTLFAGDDALLLPTVAVGGRGIISVAGNVVPDAMRELLAAARHGDSAVARGIHAALSPLFAALSAEPNPIPIKCALALAGIAGPVMRLPLLPATSATRATLQLVLGRLDGAFRHA